MNLPLMASVSAAAQDVFGEKWLRQVFNTSNWTRPLSHNPFCVSHYWSDLCYFLKPRNYQGSVLFDYLSLANCCHFWPFKNVYDEVFAVNCTYEGVKNIPARSCIYQKIRFSYKIRVLEKVYFDGGFYCYI